MTTPLFRFFALLIALFSAPDIAQAQPVLSSAAQTAGASGDFKPAISELSAILAKEPNNIAALTNRANLYNKSGEPDKALADAKSAIKLNANNYNAVFIAGSSLIALRKPEQAVKYFDTALVLKPDWLQALQFRGKLLVQTGDYATAIIDLTRVISADPKGPEAYLLRARAYTKKYQNKEAIEDYMAAAKLAPEGSPIKQLAREEIQVPIKEFEEMSAAMGGGSIILSAPDDASAKADKISKEFLATTTPLADALPGLAAEMVAQQEKDRAAFDKAKKACIENVQKQEAAYQKARRALEAINHPKESELMKKLASAHQEFTEMLETVNETVF